MIEARTSPKVCLWYWGEPGTGKTRKATDDHPQAYKKLVNKWWDGYQGQKVVIMDDLPLRGAECLHHHLKLWADPWQNHPGESKGSQLALVYDTFIVTSNYSIKEISAELPDVEAKALLRRFKQELFLGPL